MKLFIWNDPYRVNYGGSIVYVVADDLESAKKMACSKVAHTHEYGSRSHYEKDWTNLKLGEPTQVYDVPCAVWDEWSE